MFGVLRQGYLSVWWFEAGIPQCLEARGRDTSVSGGLRQGYLSVWCLEAGIPQCPVS